MLCVSYVSIELEKKRDKNNNLEMFINSGIVDCVINCSITNYPNSLWLQIIINIYYVTHTKKVISPQGSKDGGRAEQIEGHVGTWVRAWTLATDTQSGLQLKGGECQTGFYFF